MSDREQYKIMIENDVNFVIDKIIEKNDELTSQGVKIEELENKLQQKENIIKEAIEYLGINEEILKTCKIYDVNGIEVYKILRGVDK